METGAIRAEQLGRNFGSLAALAGLDLTVRQPEIFGLVGPDGAGKTTTLRLLSGVLAPSSGRAWVLGYDIVEQVEQVKALIGYMPQRFSLYPDLSVRENLAFFAEVYGVYGQECQERMAELLRFARLSQFGRRRAEYLSGGMKQKLALACTLIHRPQLLLLDEPTTGVDPVARREFWGILYHLLGRGVTILVSTPYMDEAERCNRVGFLAGGRLLTVGTPQELKSNYPYELLEVRGTAVARAREVLQDAPGVLDVQIFGETLHLVVSQARESLEPVRGHLWQAGLEQGLRLRPIAPSMEDVFMALLRQQG
ncbi:MAG: ABC transporter ATP-binding protein [Chloroflexia bacterium]|nr:ABC transporter ATP-binding protein [Chloroflexia bacterium]